MSFIPLSDTIVLSLKGLYDKVMELERSTLSCHLARDTFSCGRSISLIVSVMCPKKIETNCLGEHGNPRITSTASTIYFYTVDVINDSDISRIDHAIASFITATIKP